MKTRMRVLFSAVLVCCGATLSAQADHRVNQALAATGAVASQKDDPFGMPATRGNDGAIVVNTDFSHTGNADNEWWEVNLGGPKTIALVRLWLRCDGIYGTRDSNLRLVIYNNAAHASVVYSADLPDGNGIPLPYRQITHALPSVVTGQVVRIEHPTGIADYLQINEVQVFNQDVEEVNLALTGYASQSTTYSTYGPQRANDGVAVGLSGAGNTGSTAHTDGTEDPLLPWWQLDLGGPQPISAIRVFLSADTPQTRNDDLAVVVMDGTMAVVSSNYNAVHPPAVTLPGHDFPSNKEYLLYTFNPPISGQFVQVSHTQTNAQYLVLPEVEVFKAYSSPPQFHIAQGPTNRTVDLNSTVTLAVAAGVWGANANYLSYQWQSNGVDIAGANGATYTTPLLQALGNYTYGVKVILPGTTVTTQAVITVFSDIVPPAVVGSSFATRSTLRMTLSFSEALDAATATNLANYALAGGPTLANAVLAANGQEVSFDVAGLYQCDTYNLAVSGVKDLAGNTIVSTNLVGSMPAYQINYALDGTATESSDPFGYPARNAIDGNTGNLMHTGNADNEWWEVDLGAPKAIGQIALYFRRDCCETRDGNLVISVLDNPTARNPVWVGAINTPLPLTLNPRLTNFLVAPMVMGQIVRVEHPSGSPDYLDFAEVQVLPPAAGLCIVSDPLDQATYAGGPASFSVTAQGPPPLQYQWQHAGTNLPGATDSTLVIPSAGPAQAGLYTVLVANASRQRLSAPATLTLVPAATVTPILKVDFKGTLNGTAYTRGPGEVDVTGTFAALMGTEGISHGLAWLDSTLSQGFSVTNGLVDQGSGVTTNFLAEMVFIPTPNFDQGTGQNSAYADLFTLGSTYWSDANHSDGVFALRYTSPTSYELRVDSVNAGGTLSGTNLPLPGVRNHLALVYLQGPGKTNNVLNYYLNGSLVATMPLANNVGSSGIGSVYATFGQAVPGGSFAPRGVDGQIDALAYSLVSSGPFNPAQSFLLQQALTLKIGVSGSQIVLTWDAADCVLQENTSLTNSAGWTDVAGASPVTLTPGPGFKFYRLRQ